MAILAALPLSTPAQETHLDIKVPDLLDTDLSGWVKSVDTKVSVNVSGKFKRELKKYDRTGNLLNETEWDPEGKCINTLTNYYGEDGNFERQLYMDHEDGFTNDWQVVLSPDTRQIAKKKKNGAATVCTYSPEGYLLNYRYFGSDKTLRSASSTKRDEKNRSKEYTKMDGGKKPLYTYWFKWRDEGFIDRERQRYRQEKGERLHVYDYLETDGQGNWLQRLMVRYDIGGKKKEKVYERLVARTIEYFEVEKEPVEARIPNAASTHATEEASSPKPSREVSAVESNMIAEAATPSFVVPGTNSTETFFWDSCDDNGKIPEPEKGEFKAGFDYTFDDLADKLVIITCKGEAGRSAGSGFVAKMNGRTYLFTNQHVIMGADTIRMKTANGETLLPRGVELSKTRDIARIRIDDRDGFKISEKFAMGIPLGVFGNSEGAGVATELFGEVTGIGVDLVEVSAEFVSGNSGSPVLDKNQEVIGIASYVRVFWEPGEDQEEEDDEPKSKTRRFCYRLTNLEWKPVKWKDYNNRYGKLYRNSETMSANVFNIVSIWSDSPLEKIPDNNDMAQDLADWARRHNDIIDRYQRRQFRKKNFLNAYSESLGILSKACRDRSRRASMFAKQRELSGFLREEFEKHSYSLEYAGNLLQAIADNI